MPPGALSEGNRLALKNLAQGTTDETLMKVMRDLALNPTKVFIVNFDKEACAHICFADYKSCKCLLPSGAVNSLPASVLTLAN